MDYTLETETREKDISVKLKGLLTIYTVSPLKAELGSLLESNNQKFILDLSGVEKIDTAGLQLLMMFKKYAEELHRAWEIQNHSHEVLKLFDLYGVVGYFGHPVRIQAKDRGKFTFSYGTKKD